MIAPTPTYSTEASGGCELRKSTDQTFFLNSGCRCCRDDQPRRVSGLPHRGEFPGLMVKQRGVHQQLAIYFLVHSVFVRRCTARLHHYKERRHCRPVQLYVWHPSAWQEPPAAQAPFICATACSKGRAQSLRTVLSYQQSCV